MTKFWKISCIMSVVLATGLGLEGAPNSSRKVEQQEQFSAAFQSVKNTSRSNTSLDVSQNENAESRSHTSLDQEESQNGSRMVEHQEPYSVSQSENAESRSHTGLDLKEAQGRRRIVEQEEPYSAVSQRNKARSKSHSSPARGGEVCFRHCGWWWSGCTTYRCRGGVCCTPGSRNSICCSYRRPVCVGSGRCCPRGAPKRCGQGCCEDDHYCCNGKDCCSDRKSCCGDRCCSKDAPCCRHEGSSECCSKTRNACCDGYGCVVPCGAPFDVIGCEVFLLNFGSKELLDELWERARPKRAIGDKLYRILRPDENPSGIVAKDPSATRTVLSHVNCGGRKNYPGSQYISTSASLDVSRSFKLKGELKGLTDLRICEFDVNHLRGLDCIFVDLTDQSTRDLLLGNAFIAKNFARAYAEVLIQCRDQVPCTVVDPPPQE